MSCVNRTRACPDRSRTGRSILSTCSISAIPIPTPCDGNREHPPLVDFHLLFVEAGDTHELVHLRSRSPAHDPRLAFAVAEHARDELHLRMPRLVRVDKITARLYCFRQTAQ